MIKKNKKHLSSKDVVEPIVKKADSDLKKASRGSLGIFLRDQVLPYVAGGVIGVSLLAGAGQFAFRSLSNDLPKQRSVDKEIERLNIDDEITWSSSKIKPRFVFPRDGTVFLNMNLNLTDKEKRCVDEFVEEANMLFKAVNPNYSLRVEYNPSLFKSLYCINVTDARLGEGEGRTTLGICSADLILPTINGSGVYKSAVELDMKKLRKSTLICFKRTLAHEIVGHGILCMGDAYLVDGYENKTMMQSANCISDRLFEEVDIKNMFAKYGTNYTEDQINDFIEYYSKESPSKKQVDNDIEYIRTHFGEVVKKYGIDHGGYDPNALSFDVAGTTTLTTNNYLKLDASGVLSGFCTESLNKLSVEKGSSGMLTDYGITMSYGDGNVSTSQDHSSIVSFDDGVVVDGDGMYFLRYKNRLFGIVLEDKDGEKTISPVPYGTIVDSETYDKHLFGIRSINDMYREKNLSYGQMCSDAIGVFCDWMSFELLPPIDEKSLDGFNMTNGKAGYRYYNMEFTDSTCLFTSYEKDENGKYTVPVTNEYYYNKCDNVVYLSNGACLFKTQNGYYFAELTYEGEKASVASKTNGLAIGGRFTGYVGTVTKLDKEEHKNTNQSEEKQLESINENQTGVLHKVASSDKRTRIERIINSSSRVR